MVYIYKKKERTELLSILLYTILYPQLDYSVQLQ